MYATAFLRSNNTNKLSPQELVRFLFPRLEVQIIQINLALKNTGQMPFIYRSFK